MTQVSAGCLYPHPPLNLTRLPCVTLVQLLLHNIVESMIVTTKLDDILIGCITLLSRSSLCLFHSFHYFAPRIYLQNLDRFTNIPIQVLHLGSKRQQ